jgi:hypothetical protein
MKAEQVQQEYGFELLAARSLVKRAAGALVTLVVMIMLVRRRWIFL